ncbi:MAG: diguanylate cyclase [Alphaproteobacteria bacterium]
MSSLSAPLLSKTIDDHIAWMSAWTRIACCEAQDRAARAVALSAPESFALWKEAAQTLQDKPMLEKLATLYDQLHRIAHLVVLKAPEGAPLAPEDYDSVALKYQEFIIGLRRLERALAAADSGLDVLTGLRSRSGMRDDLSRELSRFRRGGKPFCLALMDIDHFKKINDRYGHDSGDKVLAALALHVGRQLRPYDDIWRWGGEEFLLCLKDADLAAGIAALGRIRAGLEKMPIKLSDGQTINVTASFGIAVAGAGADIDEMLANADKALYRAKTEGRNRVAAASVEES